MEKSTEKKNGAGTHAGKEGPEASGGSQSRMEAEGERFLKTLSALLEKYMPEPRRKALENLAEQGRRLLSQANKSIEENTGRVVQRLNIPTRQDFEEYNKKLDTATRKLRENMGAGVKRGLNRLHVATSSEVEDLARAVGRLREEVNALSKRTSTRKKAAAPTSA